MISGYARKNPGSIMKPCQDVSENSSFWNIDHDIFVKCSESVYFCCCIITISDHLRFILFLMGYSILQLGYTFFGLRKDNFDRTPKILVFIVLLGFYILTLCTPFCNFILHQDLIFSKNSKAAWKFGMERKDYHCSGESAQI